MSKTTNFLLGYGERLTQSIIPVTGGGPKAHPYTFEESLARLAPLACNVTAEINHLPAKACPRDEAVAIMSLHPTYLAKSYFPSQLLESSGLRSVGSRQSALRPRKTTRKDEADKSPTVEIFVAGKRDDFNRFTQNLVNNNFDRISNEIIRIEDFRVFNIGERVKQIVKQKENIPLEIAIHAFNTPENDYILETFKSYLGSIEVELDYDRRIQTNGICFFPAYAPYERIPEIEKFSFLRVVRAMPKLRIYTPNLPPVSEPVSIECSLPDCSALDSSIKVAIFDGGIRSGLGELDKWVSRKKTENLGKSILEGTNHGLAVTSAFLFGPIVHGALLEPPYAKVDHYRVIDEFTDVGSDLFDVLPRILNVLERGQHQFVNLSVGPDLPVEDDEVEAWTSSLDEALSDGNILATIAVGNSGDLDKKSGNARIQVPSDCVNGMAVGACDKIAYKSWSRAKYSCLGPGRSPGLVKPDVVAFGGTSDEPFFVLNPLNLKEAIPVYGTSFATPNVLRTAVGIRAHFGNQLSALAIKALIINKTDCRGHSKVEVGWGRVPNTIDEIVRCSEGVVTVVYQGKLLPSKYIRAQIPVPNDGITGVVTITATLCFASETDSQDSSNYTRSGIEIVFRPNENKSTNEDSDQAATKSFFTKGKMYKTESDLRNDAHKWETVLHASHNMRGTSLANPTFDIHYNARTGGGKPIGAQRIPYALVITFEAKKDPLLYNKIVNRYRTQLEPLMPVIEIPIRAHS